MTPDHRAAGIEKMKQAITTELGHIFEFDGDPFEFVNDIATAALAAWEAHTAEQGMKMVRFSTKQAPPFAPIDGE